MKKFSIPKIKQLVNWESIAKRRDFTYPWKEEDTPATSFAAYYDDTDIYFRFVAEGPKPLMHVVTNHKLEVIHSERVEIFFRSDDNMNPYYVLEMDPLGRVLDYKAVHYRDFDRSWQWPDSLAIQTEIHDEYYTLQGKFKLETLASLGVLQNKEIQIGLYRGHCIDLTDGVGTIKWSAWVDPKTTNPDFHVPSSFGRMILD